MFKANPKSDYRYDIGDGAPSGSNTCTLTVDAGSNDAQAPNLSSNIQCECGVARISFTPPATTPASGIRNYALYRDGRLVNNPTTMAQAAVDSTWLEFGVEYVYTMTTIDNDGNESLPSLAARFTPLTCVSADPHLKTRVLMFNFPERTKKEPLKIENVADLLFKGGGSIRAYIEEVSYGIQTLSGSTHGWHTMPEKIHKYCPRLHDTGYWMDCDIVQMANAAIPIIDNDIDFTGTDRLLFMFQGTLAAGFAFGNVQTNEGAIQSIWVAPRSIEGRTVVAHELGHQLNNLGHAASLSCPGNVEAITDLFDVEGSGCTPATYGDRWDAMASPDHPFHFSTFHKLRAGFLDTSQTVRVTATPGGTTVVLDQMESPSSGTKMALVTLDSAAFYFAEYRHSIGFDAGVEGVLVRFKPGYGTYGDTFTFNRLLQVGDIFDDPYRQIRVEVLSTDASTNGGQATIRIYTY